MGAGGGAGGVRQDDSQARTRMSSQQTEDPVSYELAWGGEGLIQVIFRLRNWE